MKKKILISAGGTGAAWHLALLAAEKFAEYFDLLVCDINPDYLTPAASLAADFFQVPRVDSAGYRAHMLGLFAEHGVDIFVPLIDSDVHLFPCDDAELARLGVRSTGMTAKSSGLIGDKRGMAKFLESQGFRTPRMVPLEEVAREPQGEFFVKPERGFGSLGARRVDGAEVLRALTEEPDLLVQEVCRKPEVTVEVFNGSAVASICRERVETKAGVCTKARIFVDRKLQGVAERLCTVLELPVAFCFQAMTGADGEWVITDINPRLGAGTAMSTAYGWSLASAALVCYGDLPLDPWQYLRTVPEDRYVLRVYRELVME